MKMAREDYPLIKITRGLISKQYCYLRSPRMSVDTLLGAQHYKTSIVFFFSKQNNAQLASHFLQ